MIITRLIRERRAWRLISETHRVWSKATFHSSSPVSAATKSSQELFEYTSGRWLYNESLRLAERRLVFNVNELKRTAAKCLGQPESEIKEFFKLAEGGFHRVFQVTMKDGSEVLARLPYPATKPDRLTTASEVATLDLARAAGVPTPKVLDYSTDADNPVGAEFMILEKVPGRTIGDKWLGLTEDQRLKIIFEVVQTEAKLADIDLPQAYGSVYYERDLPADMPRTVIPPTSDHQGLCIGPYVDLRWWHNERGSMDIDRGPYTSPFRLVSGVAAKELAWLKVFGRPRLPFERAYRECMKYEECRPEQHMESLKKYMKIAPYLVPRSTRLQRPILYHPDLQPNNIFVSEKLEIVGIVDWQHCSVLPQFLGAGIPKCFQSGDDEEPLRFTLPELSEHLAKMNHEGRAQALETFRRRHLHFFYLGFTQRLNEAHFEALDQGTNLLTRKIFSHAGEPWDGNNIPLRADLVQVTRAWRELTEDNGYAGGKVAVPQCPISFAEPEAQHTINRLQQLKEMDTHLENIRNAVGTGTDGWTS